MAVGRPEMLLAVAGGEAAAEPPLRLGFQRNAGAG
jgi:hypothetical protein